MTEAMSRRRSVQNWLQGNYSEESKAEIRELIKANPKLLIDAFYANISFGTAGLRGIMGAGINRINVYTVRTATQGLANYILKTPGEHSVFISYDSRHHSREFAEETARVLAANGIKAYITKELRPTPFVSYGVRELKCTAAVMITASHNPPEYNGYKVYWRDGGQVVPPHDKGIMEEVGKIKDQSEVKLVTFDHPLIHTVEESLDKKYLDVILHQQFFPKQNLEKGPTLNICYTALYGTGMTLLPQGLREWGFTTVNYVDEQCKPNGDFPTTPKPNPEEDQALKLGIDLLTKTNSDILFATDPDADRLGIVVMHEGKPAKFTGSEIASICVEHICQALEEQGRKEPKGAFVTTIVTTELLKTVASAHGLECFEVLTGFKYIGAKIHEWEQKKEGYHFLFGAEESCGFLLGTHCRDKDGIIASCLLAEVALKAKLEGKTLVDKLYEIYHKYGMFREKAISISFPGKEGHGYGREDRSGYWDVF